MTKLDNILKSNTLLCQQMSTQSNLWSYMDVKVGPIRRLSAEELMLLNSSAGEDSLESRGLPGDQTSQY